MRLPAAAVAAAAGGALQLELGESPLPSLRLAPRLSLRLHTDFATLTLPLDIRAAADLEAQAQAAGGLGARLRRLMGWGQRSEWWWA